MWIHRKGAFFFNIRTVTRLDHVRIRSAACLLLPSDFDRRFRSSPSVNQTNDLRNGCDTTQVLSSIAICFVNADSP